MVHGSGLPPALNSPRQILRNFSAPVRLDLPRDEEQLAFLMGSDADSFNRWDAAQSFAERMILRGLSRVVLGVHFPGDIVAGASMGTTTALMAGSLLALY